MKLKLLLTPKQSKEFLELDEDTRIGTIVTSKTVLEGNRESWFEGVVESYTVGYGEVSLICEGEEVFE